MTRSTNSSNVSSSSTRSMKVRMALAPDRPDLGAMSTITSALTSSGCRAANENAFLPPIDSPTITRPRRSIASTNDAMSPRCASSE